MLQCYGTKLGFKLLRKGKLKFALKYLVIPVNYWRHLEYQLVLKQAEFQKGEKVLDIGSPKLLALYLASHFRAEIFATDLVDYFIEELAALRSLENIPSELLHLCTEDGRCLSFEDRFFDKVYSISVVEHIPDDGDSRCLREINRVLKKGGQCFLTVPFSPDSREEYSNNFYWAGFSKRNKAGQFFFQRRYNEDDLFQRLIRPSGMCLKSLQFVGEKILQNSQKEVWDFLPVFTGPIQPLISKAFHTKPADSWRMLKKPLCAFLVLEKQ